MADEKIKIEASLNDKASAGFRKMASNIDKDTQKMAKSFAIGQLGLDGLQQSMRTLITIGTQSIQNSLKHEEVMRKLEVTTGRTAKGLDQWAEAMQRSTGVSSDMILEQARITLGMGKSEAFTKRALEASIDYAAFMGRDFVEVHKQATQSLSGTAREIGYMIPELKTARPEALRAGEAFDAMAGLSGGMASSSTQSREGKLRVFKESIEDVKQSWGDLALVVAGGNKSIDDGITMLDTYTSHMVLLKETIGELPNPLELTMKMFGLDEVEEKLQNVERIINAMRGLKIGGAALFDDDSNNPNRDAARLNERRRRNASDIYEPGGYYNPPDAAMGAYKAELERRKEAEKAAADATEQYAKGVRGLAASFEAMRAFDFGVGFGPNFKQRPNPGFDYKNPNRVRDAEYEAYLKETGQWVDDYQTMMDDAMAGTTASAFDWASSFSNAINSGLQSSLQGTNQWGNMFTSLMNSFMSNALNKAMAPGGALAGLGGLGSFGLGAAFSIVGAGVNLLGREPKYATTNRQWREDARMPGFRREMDRYESRRRGRSS